MANNRYIENKINHIHERPLHLVYNDYKSKFEELLIKANSAMIIVLHILQFKFSQLK